MRQSELACPRCGFETGFAPLTIVARRGADACPVCDRVLPTVVTEDTFVRFTTAIKSKPHHKSFGLKVNQIIEKTKEIDLDDDKRNWFNKSFNEKSLQDSKPLFIDEKGNVLCK